MVRLAITLLGRAAGKESILPAEITTHCRSLMPLGVGPVVGMKGRPLFTRPMVVWHHLKRLQKYHSERWAQQQQSRVTKQRQEQRRAKGKSADVKSGIQQQWERCPGKGGAKKAAKAYASDFYMSHVVPQGARRGSQYKVEEPRDGAANSAGRRGRVVYLT